MLAKYILRELIVKSTKLLGSEIIWGMRGDLNTTTYSKLLIWLGQNVSAFKEAKLLYNAGLA